MCYKMLSKQTLKSLLAHMFILWCFLISEIETSILAKPQKSGANTMYLSCNFVFVYLLIFCLPELKPELQSWDGSSWALFPRMLDFLVVQLEKGLSSLKMKSLSKSDSDTTFLKFQENLNPVFQSGFISINCSPDPVGAPTLHVSS